MVRMLILYATEEGQTAKIATKIAERLRSTGTWVDLYAVDEIPDSVSLEPYERIVIGGSIHAGHFSPKLKKWVKRHAFVLNALPTTFFTVSLGVVENDPRARAQIADIAASLCVDTKWQPGRVVHFGGALAYSKYGWLKKRIMRSIAKRAGHLTDPSRDYDYTDWDDVAKFSDSLVSSPLPRPGISGSAKLSLSLALLLAAGTAAPVARAGEGQPSAEWAGKMRELREVY